MTQHKARTDNHDNHRPLVIGLTGGIGSGKSTVANFFAEHGITIVDADRLAHELVKPDQSAYAEVVASFGALSVAADGTLNRAWLRQQIHANPESKQKLESILHPRIRARMQTLLAAAPGPYCIAVIPLLVETGQSDLVDRTLWWTYPSYCNAAVSLRVMHFRSRRSPTYCRHKPTGRHDSPRPMMSLITRVTGHHSRSRSTNCMHTI